MPGKFKGLTDLQWEVIAPLIPDPFIGYVGRPHAPFRDIINTIVWVLMSGARWADVPINGRDKLSQKWSFKIEPQWKSI